MTRDAYDTYRKDMIERVVTQNTALWTQYMMVNTPHPGWTFNASTGWQRIK